MADNDEQRAALNTHNDARAQKGVAGLNWDAGLANEAQAYAQQLANSKNLQHSGVQGMVTFIPGRGRCRD